MAPSFPTRVSSVLAPRVTRPQGLTWEGPPVQGEAKLWDPFTIALRFPGVHRLSLMAGGALRQADVPAEKAPGKVVLQSGGPVDSATVTLGQPLLRGDGLGSTPLQPPPARHCPPPPARATHHARPT